MKHSLIVRFLIAIALPPLAVGLTCRTCMGPSGCRYVKVQTCTDSAANMTSRRLDNFHPNVPHLNSSSSSFSCLAMQYTNAKNTSMHYHLFGCVHHDLSVCSLPLKPDLGLDWSVTRCFVCSTNNCNRNSAGKLGDSAYIIAATISVLLVLLLLAPAA